MSIDTSTATRAAPAPATPLQREAWRREAERNQFADWFHAYEALSDAAATSASPQRSASLPTTAVASPERAAVSTTPAVAVTQRSVGDSPHFSDAVTVGAEEATFAAPQSAAPATAASAATPERASGADPAVSSSRVATADAGPVPGDSAPVVGQLVGRSVPGGPMPALPMQSGNSTGVPGPAQTTPAQIAPAQIAPSVAAGPVPASVAAAAPSAQPEMLQAHRNEAEMLLEADEVGPSSELAKSTARSLPAAAQTPLPFRVHTETSPEGTTAWIALPAQQMLGADQLPALIAELDRALQAQGQTLWRVVCNGQVVWRRPGAGAAGTVAVLPTTVLSAAAETSATDSNAEPSLWVQTPNGPRPFNQLFKEA